MSTARKEGSRRGLVVALLLLVLLLLVLDLLRADSLVLGLLQGLRGPTGTPLERLLERIGP